MSTTNYRKVSINERKIRFALKILAESPFWEYPMTREEKKIFRKGAVKNILEDIQELNF
jgi:hypothetical protein